MSAPAPINIKHFVLVCPKAFEPSITEKVVESVAFPFHIKQENSTTVLMVLPRVATDHVLAHFGSMVCGDSQDFDPTESMFLGNGVHIHQATDGSILFASSLTGLPAMYIYRDANVSVVADTIESIARLPFCSLHFDLQAIAELAKIGAPVNYRTLFKEISIIPAASLVTIKTNDVTIEEAVWRPPVTEPYDSLESYVDSMAGMMQSAIARMGIDQSFIALTAGLDTRAVLASLAQKDKLISAFTISGDDLTLDAMRARQLCAAYGMQHEIVSINNAPAEKLPEYSNLASRFSGGLNSIEQATELYFYEMTGSGFNGRLSGNLGNQVGRSGTEGTGIRNAPTGVLSGIVGKTLQNMDERHWFFQVNTDKDLLAPEFLIQRENLFAQLGNYSIGHEMMNQHTPYADRLLIGGKYREPLSTRDNPASIADIKMRDLKHRILGQSPDRSFQCRVVQNAGGAVATCPINWGWTTNGGFSVPGLYYGAKAFTDIAIGNKLNGVPGMQTLLKAVGIKGFSSFHTQHILYADAMQRFIKDALLDKSVRECGIFNSDRLDYLIDNGFDDKSYYEEIVLALDIALASQNFGANI